MRLRTSFVLFLAVALVAAGCGKPEDKFIGKYTGKTEISAAAAERLDKAGAIGAQLKEMMSKIKLDLELKKDKTYTIATTIQERPINTSGTWSLEENKVLLKPTSGTNASGQQTAITTGKTMTLLPSEDGKTLTADTGQDPQGLQSSVVFTRA